MTKIITTALTALTLSFSSLAFALPTHINTASAEEIAENLSGIGEKKAAAIIAYRDANGIFESAEDIMKVKGIGKGIFSKIKDDLIIEKAKPVASSKEEAKTVKETQSPQEKTEQATTTPTETKTKENIESSLSSELLDKALSPAAPQS